MKTEVLYGPAFAMVRVLLEHGESIRAESGAMASMSPTISIESKAPGGLGKMIGRLFGGESIFQTHFSATSGHGEVLLAPNMPGDIVIENMTAPLVVTSGCYLAGSTTLNLETISSMKSFFSGEGLFMMRVSGTGELILNAFGAIHTIQLIPGQQYIVDTGHLVAFSDGMDFKLKKAAKSLIGSVTSGEGIVCVLTGPGTIYMQSRTPSSFAGWVGGMIRKE